MIKVRQTNYPKGTRVAVLFADGIYSGETQKVIGDYTKPVEVKFDDGEVVKVHPRDMVIVESSDFKGRSTKGVVILGFKIKPGDPIKGQRIGMDCNGGLYTGIMRGVLPDDGNLRERLDILLDTGGEREVYRDGIIILGPPQPVPESKWSTKYDKPRPLNLDSDTNNENPCEGEPESVGDVVARYASDSSELAVGETIEYKKRKSSRKIYEAVVKKFIGDGTIKIKVEGIRTHQVIPMDNIVSVIRRCPI